MSSPITVTLSTTAGGTAAISGSNNGDQDGIYGFSSAGVGVHGCAGQGSDPDGPAGPGVSEPPSCGVFGESGSTEGVFGASAFQHGVHGVNGLGGKPKPAYGCGVLGESNQGYGVYGSSNTQNGLFATSGGNDGIHGETTSQSHVGVSGLNNSAWPCLAILGTSTNGHGVKGVNGSGSGDSPTSGCGVWGDSNQGWGVFGSSKSGTAGMFQGNVSVTGALSVTGDISAKDVNVSGNVNVASGGDVKLAGADCAEQFDLCSPEIAEPGTVMVIDNDGALRMSDKAYDRAVAGVVSGAGYFRPAIVLDQRSGSEPRANIALVGKVYCKVDADAGPISVGDLLTSSDRPGHAMRVSDPLKGFGSVLGKALRPMESGQGLLPILVALQ
jgi:hypothetical protein